MNPGMSVPMVFMVGIDQLDQIPEFLDLGVVVVVAPDRKTFARWWDEHEPESAALHRQPEAAGVVVDMTERRVRVDGKPLELSDLEFRVLARLCERPGAAVSFGEIARAGWGPSPYLPIDIYTIRSLIQRLRVKLKAMEFPLRVEAVKGFGFRVDYADRSEASHGRLVTGGSRKPGDGGA
jgi:DNA-binding response OmpR family regulator